MEPVKALGRAGVLGNFLNHFDGSVEVLDDLDDHWTAKNHKDERRFVIEDLQDLAADKSCRVTILSGDVHLAAVGQFYSNPKLRLAKHRDFRYMPNVISSAVVNAPPPDLMADVLNRRNKVHHFDKETDEDMIPLFTNGVDGKPRNNKRLLPHRNWCSIRAYQPGYTPPSTPPNEEAAEGEYYDDDENGSPPPTLPGRSRSKRRGSSLLRRLSLTRSRSRGPTIKPDVPQQPSPVDRSRPPLSGGSFMRSLTMIRRRGSVSSEKGSTGGAKLTRTRSLGAGGSSSSGRGFFSSFRRSSIDQQQQQGQRPSTRRRPDDGGINGTWGVDSDEGDEEEDIYGAPPLSQQQQQQQPQWSSQQHLRAIPRQQSYQPQQQQQQHQQHMSLRGGAGDSRDMANVNANTNMEFEAGDDSYFRAAPRRAFTQPIPNAYNHPHGHPNDYDDDDNSDESDERQQRTHQHHRDRMPSAPMPDPRPGAFRRTPTGLSAKQLRKRAEYEVDLEGGLDVCLNVEVNPRDPAGITVPYRLLVPRLWYEEEREMGEDEEGDGEVGGLENLVGGVGGGGGGGLGVSAGVGGDGGVGGGKPNPNPNQNPNPNNSSYISNSHADPTAPVTMSGGRGEAAGYGNSSNARLPPPSLPPQQQLLLQQQQQQPQPQPQMQLHSLDDISAGIAPGNGGGGRRSSFSGGIKRWFSGRGRGGGGGSQKQQQQQQQYRGPPPEDDDNDDDYDDDEYDDDDDDAAQDEWNREAEARRGPAWNYR